LDQSLIFFFLLVSYSGYVMAAELEGRTSEPIICVNINRQ